MGTHHGYYPREEEGQVVEMIRASGYPTCCSLPSCAPHQEAWITRNMAASGATIAIGDGGLFDYYSGRVARAPLWLPRLGLEWLFRLAQEPLRLWRRYVHGNAIFLCRIGMDRLRSRRKPPEPRQPNPIDMERR